VSASFGTVWSGDRQTDCSSASLLLFNIYIFMHLQGGPKKPLPNNQKIVLHVYRINAVSEIRFIRQIKV